SVADAVFLVDNQRYVSKDFSLANNMAKINAMIVEPFYNVLCAGEEKKSKYVGAKTLDAGDIMATLSGWTVIGYGESHTPLMWLPFQKSRHFLAKSKEVNKGLQSMDKALGELSLSCRPADAGRALYLLTAPSREMNMNLVKDLGDYLRDLCPEATIRSGDYPREKGLLNVTIILSELKEVEKVRRYYERSTQYIPELQKRKDEIETKLKGIDDAAKDIPSLL
ncbi:MAG: cell division protein FtsZ, partial [Chloroflexota bacterium]